MKLKEINKEIRLEGAFYKVISPLGIEKVQKAIGPLSTKAMSVLSLKHLNCEKVKIPRSDGTSMRTCVMHGKKQTAKPWVFCGFTAADILSVHPKWQL